MKWPSRFELRSWMEDAPPNARLVVVACLRLYPDGKLAGFMTDLEPWMKRHNITRKQIEPEFNRAKLQLAEANRLKGEQRKQTELAQRAVFRDRLLSEGYCSSKSHAYYLSRQRDTSDPDLAKIMAEVFGGLWVNYYRRGQKPGARRKYVEGMMRLRSDGASYVDFVEDAKLPDDLKPVAEIMARRDEDHFGDRYVDEPEFLDIAGKRDVATDTARLLWTYYQEWAVDITANYARLLIGIARRQLTKKTDYNFG